MPGILPELKTRQDCDHLRERLGPGPVVALWATGYPLNTVDIMLQFRTLLRQRQKHVIFLLRKSAVKIYLDLCSGDEDELVYQLDTNNLLQFCSFISIIFTHDYCIGGKPKEFSGKIALFPHNFNKNFPSLNDIFADYFIAKNNKYSDFNFNLYPNHIKINKNYKYIIIPAGYPKLDLLVAGVKKAGPAPYKRIAFFPSIARRNEAAVEQFFAASTELIETFLERYPGYEFIFRPRVQSRNEPLFRRLRERFLGHPRFKVDLEADSAKYLISSDLLLSDYSAVVQNFCYATLRPTICLRPGNAIADPYNKYSLGYLGCSAKQVLAAIEDALATLPQWEMRLRHDREQEAYHAGETLPYLCDHLEEMLTDQPQPDWIVLDKGNTPFDKKADYLKLFSRPIQAWCPAGVPLVFDWAVSQHGADAKLALAAIRWGVRFWPTTNALGLQTFLAKQVEKAFSMAHPTQTLALLRHMYKKQPENAIALVWLAEALFRWQPASEDLQPLLEKARNTVLDHVLAGNISRIFLQYEHDSAAALAVLRKAKGEIAALHPEQWFLYTLLLFEQRCFDDAAQLIKTWRGMVNQTSTALRFCVSLLQLARKQESDMPRFFIAEGKHWVNIEGIDVSFDHARQAAQCLNPVIQNLEKKAARDPDLWAACSKLHAACGHYEAAGVCGWKAIRLAEVDINFLLWLTEVMKKNGDQDSALKCAAIVKNVLNNLKKHGK